MTPRIHKLVKRFYRTMSSKNQSESTAIAQEELGNSSSAELVEAEASEETIATEQVSATTDDESSENLSDGEPAAPEFKVTEKRRFVIAEDEATASASGATDEQAEENEAEAFDAFEIDLDQMKLDAAAIEREMEDLRTKLKESETRRDEAVKASEDYADRFRRAQLQLRAETEELRGRLQRTFDQKLEVARGDVVASLLDTLDNLQRAITAAEVATEQGVAFLALRDGVRATAEMFDLQLKKLGLQAMVSEGEPFNPEIHEAVELAVVPEEQDNMVLAELQRGYKFGERLLRPARVKVGRAE